jgi:alpha-galactosidase
MTRRELLASALALPFVRGAQRRRDSSPVDARQLGYLRDAASRVVPAGDAETSAIELTREWLGSVCHPRVTNRGKAPVAIKEVVLFDATVPMPPSTRIYGEGFQMLSQTGGTLGEPIDLGMYTDAKHYKLPTPDGTRTMYGALMFSEGQPRGLGFGSCRRFSGLFRLRPPSRLQVVVDTEGLSLAPGETWELEEFRIGPSPAGERPLAMVAIDLARNHPPLRTPTPPTGWCSWYCFGPSVTAQQVRDNLDVIATSMPALRYVQIDDGYQSAMGDWLDTGAAFGGNVRTVLADIRQRGFEPAIWVAPFVAEERSALFQSHPHWFIKDADGAPLRSDRVTFGGWRRGPWYALDGTHPEAQSHLEHVFRTMRTEWGCTYFKLDANFWGAMHGGRFHDARATRIEAYRRGMEAVVRGAGDSFLLGCNHPMWPSLGLIHGSRSSNDIKRTWDRIKTTGFQNLQRNWQNGRLWWNDPDAIVLASDLTDAECQFHASVIYASGGMVLSGDDLTKLPPARAAMLGKLVPPTGIAATFDDASLRLGTLTLPGARMLCLFNWDDAPESRTVRVGTGTVTDFWTGETLTPRAGSLEIAMAPRSSRVLKVS